MKDKIIYAPIIIPTLCRFTHFKRCVESLKKSADAKYTELYIGLDYPLKREHVEGYEQIKKYIEKELDGFATVKVFERKSNLGAMENMRCLIQEVFEEHDRYIFTEDDNEFSPNYLEYMNRCLQKYEDDEEVLAISGYKYPLDMSGFTGNTFTSNMYFAAFGYGIWKRKYQQMEKDICMDFFSHQYKNGSLMKKLMNQGENQYCNFVKGMLGYTSELVKDNEIEMIDVAFGVYMFMTGKKMIFPTVSKVRNWGYDNSGVHCANLIYDKSKPVTHRNFDMSCQELDDATVFHNIHEEKVLSQDKINRIVANFFDIPKKEVFRTKFAYLISRLIGIERTRCLIAKIAEGR